MRQATAISARRALVLYSADPHVDRSHPIWHEALTLAHGVRPENSPPVDDSLRHLPNICPSIADEPLDRSLIRSREQLVFKVLPRATASRGDPPGTNCPPTSQFLIRMVPAESFYSGLSPHAPVRKLEPPRWRDRTRPPPGVTASRGDPPAGSRRKDRSFRSLCNQENTFHFPRKGGGDRSSQLNRKRCGRMPSEYYNKKSRKIIPWLYQ